MDFYLITFMHNNFYEPTNIPITIWMSFSHCLCKSKKLLKFWGLCKSYTHNICYWNSSVRTVTRQWARWFGIWIQSRATYITFLQNIPTDSSGQQGLFLEVKNMTTWGCHLTSIKFQGKDWLQLYLHSHMPSWHVYRFKNCTFCNEALSVQYPTPSQLYTTAYTQPLSMFGGNLPHPQPKNVPGHSDNGQSQHT